MGQKGSRKGRRREFERALANELGKPSACPVWERGEYRFEFAHTYEGCAFFWKGRRLYVTSCEALYLYQRLVLGMKASASTSPLTLYGLRRKFGGAFLQEYLPLQTRMRREGRRSDLAREADGSYYRRLFDKYRKGEE
jgi:hypothetical protein